jgi:hypothetical protein
MRKTPWLSALILVACGGSGGVGVPEPEELDPNGTHSTYVISTIDMPANTDEAIEIGLDIDGDGRSDNGLGKIIGSITSLSEEVDLQGSVDESLSTGGIIILASVQATSLDTATGVGLWTYLGENPSNAPCAGPDDMICRGHLDQLTSFDVVPSDRDNLITGSVAGGRFNGGPGTATFALRFSADAEPVNLELIGARAQVDVAATTLMTGRLAGGVPAADVETQVLPGIHELLNQVVAADCGGQAPDCCSGANGRLIVGLFDGNDDCVVDFTEFSTHNFVSSLTAPDVDLLDGDGNFNPGVDGVDESVSVGIGFSAVEATFTP